MDSPQIKTINVNAGFGRHGMPRPPLTLTFDRLTLKLACESHLRWGIFLPTLGTLGLRVLELVAMYATDGQTDKRTDGQKQRLLPLPYGRGHNDVSKLTYNVSSEPLNPTKDYTAILFKYPRWLGVNWSAYILAKYRTQQTLICCKNPTRSTMLTAWRRRRNPVSCTSWVPN